jgi:hypothetical protein
MRLRTFLSATTLLLAATSASAARADFVPDPAAGLPPPPEQRALRWYGYQTLALDGVAGLLFAGASKAPVLFAPGYLVFLAGGPAVHAAHHRDGALVADVVLRLAVPVAAGFVGMSTAHCATQSSTLGDALYEALCPMAGFGVGAEIGMLATSVFDAIVLGWESRPVHVEARAHPAWSPTLAMGAHDVAAGVGGVF